MRCSSGAYARVAEAIVVGAAAGPYAGGRAHGAGPEELPEEPPQEGLAAGLADSPDPCRGGSRPQPDEAGYPGLLRDASTGWRTSGRPRVPTGRAVTGAGAVAS